MKKSKLIFKVNKDNTAKLYLGGKWHKGVTMVNIHGEPLQYTIEVEKYVQNKRGEYIVESNELLKETRVYRMGRKICQS